MALKEKQKQANYSSATWDDLLEECVITPSGIQDAPKFNERFSDGKFTYDYDFFTKSSSNYNPDFPGLSGSMGASPFQYAQFAQAYLNNSLVSKESKRQMTRPHGPITVFFGVDPSDFGFEQFQEYAQGMWYGGNNVTHSVGYFGFFPWLDQSSTDESKQFFGVLAQQGQEYVAYLSIFITIFIYGPLLIASIVFTRLCCKLRRSGPEIESKSTVHYV